MKKIIAFAIICLIICSLLVGCGGNASTESVQETTHETLSTEITEPEYVFAKAPAEGTEIEAYRNEYKRRIETNTLKREQEIAFMESEGYFIYTRGGYFKLNFWNEHGNAETYFNPIVYQSETGMKIWAINVVGELCSIGKKTVGVWGFNNELYLQGKETIFRTEESYGVIHYTAKEGEEIIDSDEHQAVTYEAETGEVKFWSFGEMIKQAEVPENSLCFGETREGYLFKAANGDVWAVRKVVKTNDRMAECEIIAHNVEFCITEQYLDIVVGHAPLFLKDGRLKEYNLYEGSYEAPVDDESHIMDVQYEEYWRPDSGK